MDAKDILGLPKNPMPGGPLEKRPRPPKESQRKPDGVSREVYALTGGMPPPLMPGIDLSLLKKKQQPSDEKITWQWLPFSSSARSDNLQLYHWVRIVNEVTPSGDYSFAKFNKSVDILKYTDEEYEKFLNDPTWTKEETDQLFDLCERFDLRFIVIADRFPRSRSVEELKSRYYSVSRALIISRAQSAVDVANHPLVKEPYNTATEIERKRALGALLSQTKQQDQRISLITVEAKKMAETWVKNKVGEAAEPIGPVADSEGIGNVNAMVDSGAPPSSLPSAGAAMDGSSIPASLRLLGVFLRTNVLDQMVQSTNSSAGLRTIKRVDQMLQDLGVNIKPKVPTKSVCSQHLELRKEILTLLSLQKQLQHKESEASANRDSLAEVPNTPQRSQRADVDKAFIPESTGFGGERQGKRDNRKKVGGRPADVPSSPPLSKRPRKLKSSDG
ncbi:myb-like transcription factor family protein isoform X2 [Wolffia australiana]